MLTLKKVILITLFSTVFYQANCQNHNLELNQVINFNVTTSYSAGSGAIWVTSSTFTVPSDKVWKVEGLYQAVFGTSGSGVSHTSNIIEINNGNNLMKSNTDNNILWLPSGTYAIRSYLVCNSANCSGTFYNTVNAIEFNLVP
jgi:hypothetical protein